MARLIVLDASVVIAALSSSDVHHADVAVALAGVSDDELVLAATTRTEVLIGPACTGGTALLRARDFVDGCVTVPVGAVVADEAAMLRARHRALSVPDAITLVVADLIDADVVWTFDQRWASVSKRVVLM
jgi:predicted nucleic acid-binding protein